MIDQCKKCQRRGDIQACLSTSCSHHESWIATERMKLCNELTNRLEQALARITELESRQTAESS